MNRVLQAGWSLRQRLTVMLFSLVLMLWGLSAAVIYFQAEKESQELFDMAISETASLLLFISEHELLEEEAARFFGSESALFFSSGYAANGALLATLPQRGDLIVHDELVHASMHEGLRLTRASAVSVAHNDAQAFDDAARAWRARRHPRGLRSGRSPGRRAHR